MRPPSPLDIDADPRLARTPPADFYRSARWFDWQRERLFAPAWTLAPALTRVPSPGDVEPFVLLPGGLDEALLAVRDGDALRCLSNVCTHRAKELVERPGRLATLRCGYHGRRFGLDGRCHAAPGFDALTDDDHLPGAATGWWAGLPFVSVRPTMAFEDWAGEGMRRLAMLPVDALTWDAAWHRSYTVHAHWALYVENYLEGLHVPFLHPKLNASLAMPSYRTEALARSVLQVGVGRDDDPDALPPDGSHPNDRIAAYYLWLFPHTMLNFYPWGLSVNLVVPEHPDRTRIDYLRYVWDASKMGRGAGGDLDTVEREDDEAVESVQRGLRGRLYDRGRYAPGWDVGVHAFHRMLAAVAEGRDP